MDSQGGYVLKILYVKTKESGPLGRRAPGTPPLDPPMRVVNKMCMNSDNNRSLRLCENWPLQKIKE